MARYRARREKMLKFMREIFPASLGKARVLEQRSIPCQPLGHE